MSQEIFDIDIAAAEAFLDALAPAGSFTFQTFADSKSHPEPKALARQFHGKFADHREALARLNQNGAGVFAYYVIPGALGK